MGTSEPSKEDKSLYDKTEVQRLNGIIERYRELLAAIGRL